MNIAAPEPVPNRGLMREIQRACGAPVALPARRWMLEVGAFFLRTETELNAKSRRVVPMGARTPAALRPSGGPQPRIGGALREPQGG